MGVTARLRHLDQRLTGSIAPEVPDDQWVSLQDAACSLGISSFGVAGALAVGNLIKATNSTGAEGVTRASLAAEADWRRTASRPVRVRRAVAVAISFLLP